MEKKQPVFYIKNMVEENGKTIEENNLSKQHNIPINALVEVKFDEWFGKGACQKIHGRFFVYSHDRDCDGTPLYTLSENQYSDVNKSYWVKEMNLNPKFVEMFIIKKHTGFAEENLTVIKQTEDIKDGINSLGWD
jgi:hypothetical protein